MNGFNKLTIYSRQQVFNRAYALLSLNWLLFFSVVLLTFTHLPTWIDLCQRIVPTHSLHSNAVALTLLGVAFLNIGILSFLSRCAIQGSFPMNFLSMLGFSSFAAWITTPLFQAVSVEFDLLPMVGLAFIGMLVMLVLTQAFSLWGPKLSFNLQMLFFLSLACAIVGAIATSFGYSFLELLTSVLMLGIISIVQISFLQQLQGAEVIYAENLNREAVHLATMLFSNSLSMFIYLLRILMILARSRRRGRN